MLNQGLSESAPNSPSNRDKNKKIEMKRKSTAELDQKTQAVSVIKMEEPINKHHFKFLYVIGKGGFGRVWRVEMKRNKKLYALKEMSKAKII